MTGAAHDGRRTGVLIVGGGEAGLGVATQLRALGYAEAITIISGECYLPYQRPPLSKGFLSGADDEESLTLRAPQFLCDHRIDVVTGQRVDTLEIYDDGSGVATLDDSSALDFERLAITTGATARAMPAPGTSLASVYTLRTIADAARIREAVRTGRRLVVIGGGFIGFEVAAAARARGVGVTVVEAAERLLERVCAPPLSRYCLREHRTAGIDVHLGATVIELVGDSQAAVTAVRLADGTTLPADVVIIGVGAVPAIEVAEKAGLQCRRDVVVDTAGRTSHPRVVAVGDCTEQPHPHLDGQLLTIESVHNAGEQARAAAHSLLGLQPPDRGVPWFWSDQGNLKIQIAGISHGHDAYVERNEPARLTVLYFRAGRLIAADMVNNPRDFMAVKRALASGGTIDPDRAGDVAVPVKDLLREGA
jgi:3-phenylpropionate/trans-cinnamate dioxygenase ferredoxin reductase component